MIPFLEAGAVLHHLVSGIQEAGPATVFTAAEAAARPEVVQRGLRFLMGAYSIVWLILAAYLLSLSVRLRRVLQQLRRVRERLGL